LKAVPILLFSEDQVLREEVATRAYSSGTKLTEFSAEGDWIQAAADEHTAILVIGVRGEAALAVLERLRASDAHARQHPVIVVAAEGSESLAVAALRSGASDYLVHPISDTALSSAVARQQASNPLLLVGETDLIDGGIMVGDSAAMQSIQGDIRSIASCDSNVLITGETGTGKELVASLIHRNSRRSAKPLVCINCAAIPDTLLESELFGYERGAFTGAATTYQGKLKAADGGTVFFDEIGDLSPFAQAKLLRLIETKEVQRLGGSKTHRVDIRIVAATHRDLDSMAVEDRFRRDLYFRLNVARIHIPALRDRRPDIALIAKHTVESLNRKLGVDVQGFDEETLWHLVRYEWPGNVR